MTDGQAPHDCSPPLCITSCGKNENSLERTTTVISSAVVEAPRCSVPLQILPSQSKSIEISFGRAMCGKANIDKKTVRDSIVYYYNGAQKYYQFEVSRLYRGLIPTSSERHYFLLISFCLPSSEPSLVGLGLDVTD